MTSVKIGVIICSNCVRLFKQNSRSLARNIETHGLHTKPNFTKINYNVYRGNYRSLEEKHLNRFTDIVGENRIIMDLCDLERYNVDHLKHLRGCSQIVLKPRTTKEVSDILSFCNENQLAVVPQGGNTGVAGAATPVFDEIIVTTELMKDIVHFDEISGVLVCQAGCILQDLNEYLSPHGFMMPLDLGAKGSCHIGGNISTNAGGLRLLRYGNLHGNVLGLEVVKANGEIIDCLNTLKKDNTGYHLKHMFIGSEGTLGFITKVSIQCAIKPRSVNLAFLGIQNYEKTLEILKKAKEELGEILSAFEILDDWTIKLMNEKLGISSPIGVYPFCLIIETSGSEPKHDEEKLNSFLERVLSEKIVDDGTTTSDSVKMNNIWSLRERVTEAYLRDGYVFCYDVSLPLEYYYKLVEEMREHMGNKSHRVFGFGHLGDGNLHLQVSVEKYSKDIKEFIESYLFKRVVDLNGSISAEHGIGFLKRDYLPLVKSQSSINLMKSLKKLMDPNEIMNPYKVL